MPAASGHRSLRALATSAVLSFASIASAQTTYYVNGSCGDDSWTGLSPVCEAPNGPKATIQAGIDAADHFDSVEVADGIYRGAGNKNLEFFQKEMSIHSAGGPENCIIDCEGDGLGFTFCTLPDDRPVTIEGLTVRNGRAMWAGGICIANADVEIRNCMIEQCVLGSAFPSGGAGIHITGASVVYIEQSIIRRNSNPVSGAGGIDVRDGAVAVIDECLIDGNETQNAGGGLSIDQYSGVHMSRSVVSGNRAHTTFSGFGGGIHKFSRGLPSEPLSTFYRIQITGNSVILSPGDFYSWGGGANLAGRFLLQDCEVTDNEALNGGGLVLSGSWFQVSDVLVQGNRAGEDGGGVSVLSGGNSLLERVRVVANTAGRDGGGMIGAHADEYRLRSCEFADNVAGRDGGGLHADSLNGQWLTFLGNRAGGNGGAAHLSGASTLDDSLVADNEALGLGGGVYVQATSARLPNTTIVSNAAGEGGGLYIATGSSGEYAAPNTIMRGNLPDSIIDGSGQLVVERSNIEGGWPGVGNLDVDPRFVDAANGDFRLGPGSPCIDAGDNRETLSEYDLGGERRRSDDRGMPDAGYGVDEIVDMGCYEFQGESDEFITVHPRPGIAGENNRFQLDGATPGSQVYFVYGLNTGLTEVPGCPGVGVEIANPRLIGQRVADSDGEAFIIVLVPPEASGRTMIIQAVDHAACDVSNVVRYRFP